MMTDNAIRHMDENLQRLHALQKKAASGKEFQRVSDDPAAATLALTLRSNLQTIQGYLDASNLTEDWMSANDFALKQGIDVATRAHNLTLSGSSDSLGAGERQGIAAEINVLLQQAIDLGNTTHKGEQLFSGFRIRTAPFSGADTNSDGLIDAVSYNGDAGVILRHLGPGQTITQNIDGNGAFSPLFAALIHARDALNANDTAAIQTALGEVQGALEGINDAHTVNGARQRQVRQVQERIVRSQADIKSLLSSKEDVNMAEAISNLRYQETVYQTVLEVGQRAISALSLFDILS